MDNERNEDLNPHGEDIDEKIRRMLDPSVPDDAGEAKKAVTPMAPKKSIVVKADEPALPVDGATEATPSAPELPKPTKATKDDKAITEKPGKKVAIPIDHQDAETTPPVEASTSDGAPPIKQITIDDANATPADVAEKLNETIAELGPTESDEAAPAAVETADAATSLTDDGSKEADVPVKDPAVLTDPATDKAVEEIVAAESDEILEVEDAVRDSDEQPTEAKPRHRLRAAFKALWHNRLVRWLFILLVVGGLIAAGTVPTSRYFLLNTAGVRASSSITILDDSTKQPLKNVHVSLGGATAVTDAEGNATVKQAKLGPTILTIEKSAFAPISRAYTVGWGSNPQGSFNLTPTGIQYSFTIKDFLSGKPVSKVEADSGEASAISDNNGLIKLTLEKPSEDSFTVTIKGDNYRQEQLTINVSDKAAHDLKLVPSHKQTYISKRSGKFDIYGVYIDGKEDKLVLAGTGSERENDLVLVPHPTDNVVAYVSTRANQHNSDNFLLSNLILINTDTNATTSITASERVQIVGWSGDRLVYVQIAAGASANNPKRYRLMSYSYKDQTNKELASSNYFNDVVAVGDAIYYAPSSAYQSNKAALYKVNADGSNLQTIFNQEVWNIIRTSYDHLALAVQQQWYDFKLGDKGPTKLNDAPANQLPRVYIDSPDGKHSAWIDNRDGKGVLLNYDANSKSDVVLKSQSGLTYPVAWLNDNILVYRVKTDQETADYAISLNGGDPVKIKDVTNAGGIDRWYYY